MTKSRAALLEPGAVRFDAWFWVQTAFYAVNLVAFYGFIVLPVGLEIQSKCSNYRGRDIAERDRGRDRDLSVCLNVCNISCYETY
jgi:hypothetical protein